MRTGSESIRAPIEERDDNGKRRIGGGRRNTRGTPQGDVAGPLLANIYMNRFLKHWRLTNRGKRSVHGSSPTPTTSSSLI
jgi:hypothetical protein